MTDHLNKTVLIVDDDRVFLDSLEQFLLQRGYHSKVAWGADSALRIIRDFTLDVVVADVVMPGRDGIQLMHEAKSLVPDLDFIFMTGYSYDHSYVEIINAGAADYITKPFEMMELVARIERIEREKRLVQELRSTNARLKETVDQVNAMMEDVRQTAKAKSNLLADISHEIRTPLTGILGFTDILLATELDPEQANYAKNIKMSGEVILSLINDFLDSAKVEAGKMQLEKIPFDPAEVCYDVCDLIRPRLYGKPVELLCRIGDQVPPRLIGDPHRFRQVLLNLMSNAAKFTKSGEIELSLETEIVGDASGTASVRAAVRDTGIGLAPDNMEAIFEPFRQSRNSVSREYGGTGLGLFLCKRISQMMDGDIRVTSRHGAGSTFSFLAVMKVAPEEGGVEDFSQLSGKKVLVVIPHQTRLKIVSHILENAGMQIVTADNNETAGERLQQAAGTEDPVAVCVIDACLTSGGQDGRDFIDQISRIPGLVMPPVITLIEPMVDNTRKCEQAGYRYFLSKPVRRDAL
ncbi:MAG: response regulator, partial [Desulfosudaceae bacterium]